MKGVWVTVVALLLLTLFPGGTLAAGDDDDDDDEPPARTSGTAGAGDNGDFAPLVGPAPAAGDDDADAAGDRGAGHKGQFGLSMQFALGMRGILPYHDEYCGERSEATGTGFADFCFARAPIPLDLVLSYGLNDKVEVLLELRFGLERDFGGTPGATSGPRPHIYMPGVKAYFSESGRSRLFSTLQLLFDTTGYTDPAGEELGLDWGMRNVNGLQFDVHRAVGLYVFLGDLVTWDRWLTVQVEAGIGIQGRLP